MNQRKPKRPRDTSLLAKRVVDIAIGEIQEEFPKATQRGRAGGLRGGVVRARKLSKKRKIEIARKAAKSRWKVSAGDN